MSDVFDIVPIAPKLAKLIRMLGSNHDGEKLAAVRRIQDVLKGAGADLHLLAQAIEIGPAYLEQALMEAARLNEEAERKVREAEEQLRRAKTRTNGAGTIQKTWHEIAIECQHSDTVWNTWEGEFIESMVRRTINGGGLSDRQRDKLRQLYARCRE
jgi:hypothetical protein